VIVALGAPAAKFLLETSTGITKLRGIWHEYKAIPVMPTFHPAFLLRNYTKLTRGQVWSDMKQVMEKLG
jgi:DNA polymerase